MLRLVLLVILFLISLLAVFNAPAYYLWLLAIIVTEYSWILILVTLLILLSGLWGGRYNVAGTIIGIAALLLFMSPLLRASVVASHIKEEMQTALGNDSEKISFPGNRTPFSLSRLFNKAVVLPRQSLTYVQYPDTSLSLDFYQAKASGKRPCVVVIHGGSWSSGDSRQLPELNSYLSSIGYQVASINYRLAPKYKAPATIEDVQNALNYLKAHADSLQVDTSRFVLLGRSAGAQIALLAAYTLPDSGVKAVIDFYGPADMVWGYSVPANPLVMNSGLVMERYLGGPYKAMPQKYAASSPIEFVNPQTVPTLIIHGSNDVLVAYEHSTRLNKKLGQNGIRHYWLQLPWATHGFDYNINGPGGQLSTYAVETFLRNAVQ
jgi:acetyl esterase/lipase